MKYLLHIVSTGGVTDDVALLTEHRLGGLTVEREPALRHADHVLPVHSAFIKHKFQFHLRCQRVVQHFGRDTYSKMDTTVMSVR